LSLVDDAGGQRCLPVVKGRSIFPSEEGLRRCSHYRNKFPGVKEDGVGDSAEKPPFIAQHNENLPLIEY
jgi:hypothetical protein